MIVVYIMRVVERTYIIIICVMYITIYSQAGLNKLIKEPYQPKHQNKNHLVVLGESEDLFRSFLRLPC